MSIGCGGPPDAGMSPQFRVWQTSKRPDPKGIAELINGLVESETTWVTDAWRAIRRSLPWEVKSNDCPSGLQITEYPPSLPGTGRASGSEKSRRNTRNAPLASLAVNAIISPSGDKANDCRSPHASR